MRRTNTKLSGLVCLAVVVVAGACQADDGSDGVGTPIEEPATVTESSDESTSPGTTPPAADETAAATPVTTSLPSVLSPESVFATTTTSPPTPSEPPAPRATETVYEVGMIDPGLTPFIRTATADLAERLDVDEASIEVLTAVLVTWPNSALGCPEPGRAYAQVMADGSVIELGVGGFVYRYHTGGSQAPFPCERPLQPVPTPAG